MPLNLYLIRHSETEWSISGRHTSRTEIPLTEHGQKNASELGERLRTVQFTHVFTSPRQRAQQTCNLVGLTPIPQIEEDLAEWDYGDYEGLRVAEIYKIQPGWNVFRDGCPGGEMPVHISDRADRFISRLRTLNGNVALFTHGHFGCALAARWTKLPVIWGAHFTLGTASLSILGFEPSDPNLPIISLWNAFSPEMLKLLPTSSLDETRPARQLAIERWENEGGEIPNVLRSPTEPEGLDS